MKKSKLMRVVLVIIAFVLTICIASSVHAENVTVVSPNNTSATNNAVVNNTSNTAGNVSAPNNINSSVSNTANSSAYNNTSLPKTGVESNMAVFAILTVCGISAVYAYKKVNDYKNIK